MPQLKLWSDYTREEVHAIFSPDTVFTPQAGTWGLQGMVRVPARRADWVFFVTYGQEQGEHVFDESVTRDGVLSWQSQPAQRLTDATIQELIRHDDRLNSIHLFLRTGARSAYSYLGTLGYLEHDLQREQPVHFQWQLLDWPAPPQLLERIGLRLMDDGSPQSKVDSKDELTMTTPPAAAAKRDGVPTATFQTRKTPDYAARDARNRELGLRGELLVMHSERMRLIAAGREELAAKLVHVSVVEGDGAGYDILSFEEDGRPRYIEVKTTEGPNTTAFFISPNELAFSAARASAYFFLRLFSFDLAMNTASMFILEGDISSSLQLAPTSFRAVLA